MPPDTVDASCTKRHVLISGTGRAGTTFLVQLLAACGMETALSQSSAGLDQRANAGLENIPIDSNAAPYVLKSPWAYQFLDSMLSKGDLLLDAVVIPVRNLVDASASRIIVDLHARYANRSHPTHFLDDGWDADGAVAGGVTYSLEPLDQQRILAVAAYKTIEACVKFRIPMIFLEHPRLATDADYCFEQLLPIVPKEVTRNKFLEIFSAVADAKKIRTGNEVRRAEKSGIVSEEKDSGVGPALHDLDRIAILRMLRELEEQNDAARAEIDRLKASLSSSTAECAALRSRVGIFEAQSAASEIPIHSRLASYLRRSSQR